MTDPLVVLRHPAQPLAPTLMVLLPGAYMTPEHFLEAGFAAAPAVAEGRLDLAIVAPDLAAITAGTALATVHQQVMEPARQAGYRQVWLGGISLGGFLATLYAADTLGPIDGLCLLAPYPGSRITQAAIGRAGGLTAWQPSTEQLQDPEFRLWYWLRQRPATFPIYCGYGRDDRFADGMAALAATLPLGAETRAGGHDWPVWRTLWEHFLAEHWPAPPEAA